MFAPKADRKWSDIGLRVLVASILILVGLSLLDGYMKAVGYQYGNSSRMGIMLSVWVVDFRYVFEQAVYAATIFFVGAKFFETRTILTVGFDKLDNANILLKGPDDDNVVWIGHRYGSKLEADAIASTLAERLRQSAMP